MDRRYTLGQNGAQARANQNSYIPATPINNNGSAGGNNNSQTPFSYQHVKQMSHHSSSSIMHHHHSSSSATIMSVHSANNNNTYSNLPPPQQQMQNQSARSAVLDHHHNVSTTNNGAMIHRTLPKPNSALYSNGGGGGMVSASHYGNVMTVGSPPHHNHNNSNSNNNHMMYYGTTTNGGSANPSNNSSGNNHGPIMINGTNHATILPVVSNNHSNGVVYGISGLINGGMNNASNGNNHSRQMNNMPQTYAALENSGSTEGLPPSLVESMRTLFDILDDTKQGKIRLSDIESRWEQSDSANGTGAEPLIRMGVMGYLRKVTPSDGLLTFDRFCTGLRLALLANNNTGGMVSNQGSLKHPSQHSGMPPQHHSTSYLLNNQNQASKIQMNGGSNVNNHSLYGTTGHPHHHHTMNKSHSAVPLINTNSNTTGRSSKIPSLSSSRLPMPNSSSNSNNSPGHNNIGLPNGRIVMNGAPAFNNGNSSGIPGLHKKHSEHGTTVAMVHSHPPQGLGVNNSGTLKSTGANSTHRLTNNSKSNGSLDNLKATLEEKLSIGPPKDRPPSAPLLDVDGQRKDNHHHQYHSNSNNNANSGVQSSSSTVNRRRAKSSDRDQDHDRKQSGNNIHKEEDGKKQVSFATSRQRTLSMPQLQLNKLKTKSSSSGGEQDSSSFPPNSTSKPQGSGSSGNSSGTNGLNGTLKFSVHKSHHTNGGGSSAIPTFASSRSLKMNSSSGNLNRDYSGEHHAKDLPAPPPKPPRNPVSSSAMVTIVTNGGSNSGPGDAPHSGSSVGSSSQSCSTLSSTSTNSSKVMEARKPLSMVWQKGLTTAAEKKPIEQSLSVASVTATSAVVANNKNNSGINNNGGNNGPQNNLPAPGVKSHTQHNSAT